MDFILTFGSGRFSQESSLVQMQFSGLLLLITLLSLQTVFVLSLTFDLPSLPAGGVANHRCLSTYISKDMLVVGKFSVLPADGNTLQQIQLEVTDMEGSRLFGKQDARGTDQKFAFTSHAYSDHIICFTNILQPGSNHLLKICASYFLSLYMQIFIIGK